MIFSADQHTFALCAYKESKFLEDAIISVLDQTLRGEVLVVTSTPNAHIQGLCAKYNLNLVVNTGETSIAKDWNFAYDAATTPLVTIVHQDDFYEREYLANVLDAAQTYPDAGVFHTDYYEIREGSIVKNNIVLRVKRVLNTLFARTMRSGSAESKKRAFRWGDFVCCPSVTFNKQVVGPTVFDIQYRNSCDYRTWVNLAARGVSFVYLAKPLIGHRIYEQSTTTMTIADGARSREDLEILTSLWPDFFAKAVFALYKTAQKSNVTNKEPKGSGRGNA